MSARRLSLIVASLCLIAGLSVGTALSADRILPPNDRLISIPASAEVLSRWATTVDLPLMFADIPGGRERVYVSLDRVSLEYRFPAQLVLWPESSVSLQTGPAAPGATLEPGHYRAIVRVKNGTTAAVLNAYTTEDRSPYPNPMTGTQIGTCNVPAGNNTHSLIHACEFTIPVMKDGQIRAYFKPSFVMDYAGLSLVKTGMR